MSFCVGRFCFCFGGRTEAIGGVGDSAVEGGDEEGSRWGGGCDV